MSNLQKVLPLAKNATKICVRALSGGPGEGAGKGGGAGGAVRSAGGSFGKMEAAREEEYFYKKQKAQLEDLKKHINEEIAHHKEQLEQHQKVLDRHQKRVAEIEAEQNKIGK